MDDSPALPLTQPDSVIHVPEVRDYHAINGEVVRHLERGCRMIRLVGVRGQRLLASGLTGGWHGVLEVDGDAGPELAAGLAAPGLTVICRGSAADGGASRIRAGRVIVLGPVGVAFGYAQGGGLAMALGDAGPRAGLCQRGGDLVLLGDVGPMAGERQSGGRIFAHGDRLRPHAGLGRRGGTFIRFGGENPIESQHLPVVTDPSA